MSELKAFAMPKWGIEMTEGVIGEWKVAEGQSYAKGDLLALIETDKITNEVEAEDDGVICRIVASPGETVPVGALLAVTSKAPASAAAVDAFISTFGADAPSNARSAAVPQAKRSQSIVERPASPPPGVKISPRALAYCQAANLDIGAISGSGRGGRITLQDAEQAAKPIRHHQAGAPVSVAATTEKFDGHYASPLAKKIAALHGIDLTGLTGAGPRGRIAKADVLALVQGDARGGAGVRVAPMSPMRKAIARQLTLSKTSIPHFYLRLPAHIDALLSIRETMKAETARAPSINDFLVRACALALKHSPDVNIQVHGDEIHHFSSVDIAVAIATTKGLVTPVVRAADTKSVAEISVELRDLAARARDGKLRAEELKGGAFSLSNLGMFGVEQFDAIINPPQGAILAVGAASRRPVEQGRSFAFVTQIQLSLSCDHRAIDGAVGAAFLTELRRLIETPQELIA